MNVLYVSLACLVQLWLVGPFVWFAQASRQEFDA